jgi:hypothetical protein
MLDRVSTFKLSYQTSTNILTVMGNHINNCQVLLFRTVAILSILPEWSRDGEGGLDPIDPVSADEEGSYNIPRNDEISLAVPAMTVDDLDILLSIVIGSERVACISGGGMLTAGAGAVEGRSRESIGGRCSGVISTMVRMEGERDRPSSCMSDW